MQLDKKEEEKKIHLANIYIRIRPKKDDFIKILKYSFGRWLSETGNFIPVELTTIVIKFELNAEDIFGGNPKVILYVSDLLAEITSRNVCISEEKNVY